jgi:1-pyrroline-5-carboxylate dehydrogenase
LENNIHTYKTYPRIVGETGKDFIVAHPTANVKQVVTGICRISRMRNVRQLQELIFRGKACGRKPKELLIKRLKSFKMGSPEDFGNLLQRLFNEGSFDKLASFIDQERQRCRNYWWWNYDKSKGYLLSQRLS